MSGVLIDYSYLKWVQIKWRRINSFKAGSTTIPFIVQNVNIYIDTMFSSLSLSLVLYTFYRKITYLYSVDPLIITHSRVFHTKIIIINDNISFLTNILTYRINHDDNLDYECIQAQQDLILGGRKAKGDYTLWKRGGVLYVYHNRSKSLVVRLTLLIPQHGYVSLLCRGVPTLCSGFGL